MITNIATDNLKINVAQWIQEAREISQIEVYPVLGCFLWSLSLAYENNVSWHL